MKILFVHQNFPSQYVNIIHALVAQGNHQLVALTINKPKGPLSDKVFVVQYKLHRGNSREIDPLMMDFESKLIRAQACAEAAHQLKRKGFQPDLICAHPGWGEALFLRDVWQNTPLLCYQEFFYNIDHSDCDFDPEFKTDSSWKERAKIRTKNANTLLALEASGWNVTPTQFQRSTFPTSWQPKISVIHDGIDTNLAKPNLHSLPLHLSDGTQLRNGDPIVTFVNRRFEPYRGCHTFTRSIPLLQKLVPNVQIIIVGSLQGVSYGAKCPNGEWKDMLFAEINGQYNPKNVHFTGVLSHHAFLHLLQLSAAHVYLSYPFILSWSLLEAMSCGCAVVGSKTPPIEEVIEHEQHGLLVDFFSPDQLANATAELLQNRDLAAELGRNARTEIERRFSLQRCLPLQLSLIDLAAGSALP